MKKLLKEMAGKLSAAEHKIHDLETANNALEGELADVQTDFDSFRASTTVSISEAKKSNKKQHKDANIYLNKNADSKLSRMEKELRETYASNVDDLKRENLKLGEEAESLRSEIISIKTDRTSSTKQLKDLLKNLADCQAARLSDQQNADRRIAELEEEVAALRRARNDQDHELVRLRERHAAMDATLEQCDAIIDREEHALGLSTDDEGGEIDEDAESKDELHGSSSSKSKKSKRKASRSDGEGDSKAKKGKKTKKNKKKKGGKDNTPADVVVPGGAGGAAAGGDGTKDGNCLIM